jgi:O-antigen ligase
MKKEGFWKKLVRFLEIGTLLFILLGVPLIYNADLYLMFELPKILIFRIAAILFFVLHLIRSLQSPSEGFRGLIRSITQVNLPKIIVAVIILFVLWTILSWLFSPQKVVAFWGNYDKRFGIFTLIHFGIFAITLLSFLRTSKKHLMSILPIAITIPIIVNLLVAFSQLFGDPYTLELMEGRPVGTFGQTNFMAGLMLMLIPFLVFSIHYTKDRFVKIILFLNIFAAVILIILSQSRIAWFLLLLLIFAYLLYYLWQHKNFVQYRKRIIFDVVVLGVLIVVSLLSFGERFTNFGLVDPTRVLAWKSSIELVIDSPIVGYGYDVAGYLFPTAMYKQGIASSLALDRAHNELFDIMLFGGIPYFLMVVVLMIYFLFILYKKFVKSNYHIFYMSIIISILLFWLRSVVDINGIVNYIWFVFFVFWGISEILKEHLEKPIKPPEKNEFYFISTIVIILMIELVSLISLSEYRADKYYNKYIQTGEIEHIRSAVRTAPFFLRYRIEYLDALVRSREIFEIDRVIPRYMQNQKLLPAEYHYRMGKYYLYVGDVIPAKMHFKKAVEMEPIKKVYMEALESI